MKVEIDQKMAEGALVPDALIFKAMAQELSKPKYAQGAIFDGFSRTKNQISFLQERNIKLDIVVVLYAG